MSDFKKHDPVNGIARQEEEVRDLFNLLTKKETVEQKTSVVSPQNPVTVSPVRVPNTSVETSASKIPAVQAFEDVETEETPIEEISVQERAPMEDAPAKLFVTHNDDHDSATADDVDEDDLDLELPPLVIVQYDEEYEEEKTDDHYGQYGQFILSDDEREVEYEVDAAPTVRRNPLMALWNALRGNVPLPRDNTREIVRKSLFWLSLVLLTSALTYILYNVWWLPSFTKNLYGDVAQDYHPESVGTVESGAYPQKMLVSFQTLYNRNPETRGWLSFHASGNQDFLAIEYPVMYSGDNDKYLTVDFNGNKNKNGALFFDMRAKLNSVEDTNKSLIVYGHNMASGQMLAGLNKFIGNVNNARVAPTLTMNTLFANGQYKVFAVVITDESAEQKQYFNVRRTQFADDEDFLAYIEDLRARSLFDYPVDVQAEDELVLLSTCTAPSSAKIDNGRLTVIARKVRVDESAGVNTAAIVKNTDVIMPYAWYTLQNKQPHDYYASSVNDTPDTTTTSTTTTASSNDRDDTTLDADVSTRPSTDKSGTTTLSHGSSTSRSSTRRTTVNKTTSSAATTESTTTVSTAGESTSTENTTTTTTVAEENLP